MRAMSACRLRSGGVESPLNAASGESAMVGPAHACAQSTSTRGGTASGRRRRARVPPPARAGGSRSCRPAWTRLTRARARSCAGSSCAEACAGAAPVAVLKPRRSCALRPLQHQSRPPVSRHTRMQPAMHACIRGQAAATGCCSCAYSRIIPVMPGWGNGRCTDHLGVPQDSFWVGKSGAVCCRVLCHVALAALWQPPPAFCSCSLYGTDGGRRP